MNEFPLQVVSKTGRTPEYKTAGSSGADLEYVGETYELRPGSWHGFKTGLHLELPQGVEGQIRSRSGLAISYGVTVLNSPGTIDADYRGELIVVLINHGQQPFLVSPGDRIAQLVFADTRRATFAVQPELGDTTRGASGFGSTG